MVDQTVLGCVTLGLQGTEESLLSTENLNSRGGIFGEVGQGTGVGDQTGTDHLADQGRQVGGNVVHLGDQVLVQLLSVVGQVNDALGKVLNIDHVDLGDVSTHGGTGSVDDLLSLVGIASDLLQSLQLALGQITLVLDELGKLGKLVVVVDNLDELGEVPRVPLSVCIRFCLLCFFLER